MGQPPFNRGQRSQLVLTRTGSNALGKPKSQPHISSVTGRQVGVVQAFEASLPALKHPEQTTVHGSEQHDTVRVEAVEYFTAPSLTTSYNAASLPLMQHVLTPLEPGLRLQAIARSGYEEFYFEEITYHFVSAIPTTAGGVLGWSAQLDPAYDGDTLQPINNIRILYDNPSAITHSAWENCALNIKFKTPDDEEWCSTLPGIADAPTDQGHTTFMIVAPPSTSSVIPTGDIFVSYKILLRKPIPIGVSDWINGSGTFSLSGAVFTQGTAAVIANSSASWAGAFYNYADTIWQIDLYNGSGWTGVYTTTTGIKQLGSGSTLYLRTIPLGGSSQIYSTLRSAMLNVDPLICTTSATVTASYTAAGHLIWAPNNNPVFASDDDLPTIKYQPLELFRTKNGPSTPRPSVTVR